MNCDESKCPNRSCSPHHRVEGASYKTQTANQLVNLSRESEPEQGLHAHSDISFSTQHRPCEFDQLVLLLERLAVFTSELLQPDDDVAQLRVECRPDSIQVVESEHAIDDGAELVIVVFEQTPNAFDSRVGSLVCVEQDNFP